MKPEAEEQTLALAIQTPPDGPHSPRLSKKQRAIAQYLTINTTITLKQASALVGGNIYANESKHVGVTLSNMVKRGLIVRLKPGVFALTNVL